MVYIYIYILLDCPELCTVCSGLRECEECENMESMWVKDGICECRPGYGYVLGDCIPCHPYCYHCSSGSSYTKCTHCATDTYTHVLHEGKHCVRDCPSELPGTFFDSISELCIDCHSDCHLCFGPHAHQCYSCQPPYLFYQYTCHITCPISTFPQHQTCAHCPSLSLICTTIQNSSACIPQAFKYQTACYSQCPTNTVSHYANPQLCLGTHTHTHTHIYIYIYIYIS